MSQGNRMERQGPNQVLHVRGDSDSDLEALFNVLHGKDPNQLQQTSFKNRKLPKSFFEPPVDRRVVGNHSREGSQDSQDSRKSGPSHPQVLGIAGLPINHGRSLSSPAQLPHTLSAAPPLPPHHLKQTSVDLLAEEGPPWGDVTKLSVPGQLGQRYYINDASGSSWPAGTVPIVKSNSTTTLNHPPPPLGTLSPGQSQHTSPNISLQNLGPLPPGWEQGVTQDGEIYFINHVTRTTSWFDPRIPKQLQRAGPMKVNQPVHGNPPQLLPSLPTIAPPQHPHAQLPPQLPPQLPQQQQQQQQAPPPQLSPNPQAPPTSAAQPQGRPPLPNTEYIQSELQRLQREKDRLRREQNEIMQKELLLKDMITPPHPSQVGVEIVPTSSQQTTAIQSLSINGVDPFLGQGGNSLESHARQNSADSGLGMGTNYSLPRTPEDILSNVDEMDTQEGGSMLQKIQNSDFNMNDLQASGASMDMGNLDVNDIPSGMDSDDLVPSLQEDITGLSSELLNDVDVQKMENLLWL